MFKLKRAESPNSIIISLIVLLQVFLLVGLFFYHTKTNFNTNISIVADHNTKLILETPLGNKIDIDVTANDTILIKKRPLSLIIIKETPEQQIVISDFDGNRFTSEGVQICIVDSENTIVELIDFFVILKYHYIWYILNVYLLSLLLFLNVFNIKNLIRRFRYRFLAFVIRRKNKLKITKEFLEISISKLEYRFLVFIAILYLISVFIGIGKYPISQTESGKWRALIALEMKYSDNYVTPTLNGDYYYNKPPLFNYLLVPVADAERNLEYKLRIVNVISILILCSLVYYIARKEFEKKRALLVTLLYAFSVFIYLRIAFVLMIDPFFSILMVLMFYSNYKYFSESKPGKLFLFGYFLTAVGFLTKGYQAIFFQAVSVFSLLLIYRKWKLIFNWKHIAGIVTFCVIIGGYFLLYYSVNPEENWMLRLFSDVPYKLQIGWLRRGENLLNFIGKTLLSYPFLMFVPILFLKSNIYNILKDKFSQYCLFLTVIGILPFLWGDYYPQYILMIIPFLIILIFKYLKTISLLSFKEKIFIFLLINVFQVLSMVIMNKDYMLLLILIALLNNLLLISILSKPKKLTIFFVIYFMFLFGLNIYYSINPTNIKTEYVDVKEKSKVIVDKVGDAPLYIYGSESTELNYATIYYLTYYYKDIIYRTEESLVTDNFYLSNKCDIPENAYVLDSVSQMVHYKNPDPYGDFIENERLYLFKVR